MKENTTIANFNVTFGNEDEPLLMHFDDIVFPAFISGIIRKRKREDKKNYDKYYFMNVRVEEVYDELVLMGQFVKETVLDIKTKIVDKALVRTDEHYPSAPYSVFCIFLKNHRMVLIRNEKESPDIRSFGVTVNTVFKEYLRQQKEIGKDLPYPNVHVVGIPTKETWDNIFKYAVKVKRLELKAFPLNGDQKYNDIVDSLTSMMDNVKTKTATLVTGACDNQDEVKNVVKELNGIMEPVIVIDYPNRKGVKVKNHELKEKTTFVGDENAMNSAAEIVPFAKELDGINKTTQENKEIYESFLHKIRDFIIR